MHVVFGFGWSLQGPVNWMRGSRFQFQPQPSIKKHPCVRSTKLLSFIKFFGFPLPSCPGEPHERGMNVSCLAAELQQNCSSISRLFRVPCVTSRACDKHRKSRVDLRGLAHLLTNKFSRLKKCRSVDLSFSKRQKVVNRRHVLV